MKKTTKTLLSCLLCFALVLPCWMPVAAAEQTETPDAIPCADFAEAVAVLRDNMVLRKPVVTIRLLWDNTDTKIMKQLVNATLVHTGVPTQGDYLYWHMKKCIMEMQTLAVSEGQYELTMTFTFTYRSTPEQEEQVNEAVQTLLEQLDVYNATDYEKICTIYDYICENVTYDNTGLVLGDPLIYTAYAAMIRKSAVCQGYALLFYRLALELGVDSRLISGTGRQQTHGWNIVRLGEKYYNLDCTYDAASAQNDKPYTYFLLCDANFRDHARDATYTTEQFNEIYPMAETDYDASVPATKGDLTDDGRVDEADVIYLLQYVLMPKDFPVSQAVDLDQNGKVNENDAVYLLQYILMPEHFPLP